MYYPQPEEGLPRSLCGALSLSYSSKGILKGLLAELTKKEYRLLDIFALSLGLS
jgi:hypothetical protein